MSEWVSSGQLAALVGRSRETIRRYEARGLIRSASRDPINGRRYWTAEQAEQIRRQLRPRNSTPWVLRPEPAVADMASSTPREPSRDNDGGPAGGQR